MFKNCSVHLTYKIMICHCLANLSQKAKNDSCKVRQKLNVSMRIYYFDIDSYLCVCFFRITYYWMTE